ncbi:MAG: Fic family protein [Methanomicrobiales archaeon]|jgi:fido (protein-threonine AMPylation protein)|nr:Fic family protein [Methanomicrobiales archaeon]
MTEYWKKWFIEKREGTDSFFLSKDIYFKGRRKRIRIKCTEDLKKPPDIEKIVLHHMNEIVDKAKSAKISLVSDYYTLEHIPIKLMQDFEKIAVTTQIILDFLPIHEQDIYKKQFGMRYIHGTTAIEGNTLSLQQVRDLIEFGITPQSKNKREIFEVSNFEKVLKYRTEYRGKVTLAFIKKLHELIIRETGEAEPGSFRHNDRIMIVGYDSPLCPSLLIEEQLQQIIDEYYTKTKNNYHPFEQAVLFHLQLETIHPFDDGNGRVGREVFNYMITKEGYPPMLFLGEERETYISALKDGNAEKYEEMVKIFMKMYMKLYASALPDLEVHET